MPELTPSLDRPLSDVEIDEFRTLGLTPGHWIALAPMPLFRADLNTPHPGDLQTLAKLQQPLRTESHPSDSARIAESEGFWKKLCNRTITADSAERANALLAWYLAARLPRPQRESFLLVLDTIATSYLKSLRTPLPTARPSYAVRQRIERYLPHPTFTRTPAEPHLAAPDHRKVAELFGADLWKQMLVAPIAGALAELQVRASAAASVAESLSHVTNPTPYSKPSPMELHLSLGCWRRFFEGLLNTQRRDESQPFISRGLEVAAQGLASMSYAERESLLGVIHEQIQRGIERHDQKKIMADEWIGRMRARVEDALRQALPVSELPPPPPRVASSSSTSSSGIETATLVSSPALKPIAVPTKTETPRSPAIPSMPPTPPKPPVTVERAEPFVMVSWAEALERVGQISYAEIRDFLTSPRPPGLLFDDLRTECSEVAIVRDAKHVPGVLWLIGDLHADVLALANIIAHAERLVAAGGEPPALVFLGDFVDRGRHDHEMLLLLFQLIVKNPGRVCIIPGNHDIDLQWDDKSHRFRVSIEPAEYCEQLNGILRSGDSRRQDQVEFARLLIAFWQTRPKAVVLPDGTLLAHGGFPHTDMQPLLQSPADLARPHCLNDFLWARLAETARKRPNRGNRGHEFGWETFAQFCKVSAQMGLPIKRFVRGHDHVPPRWQTYPEYSEYPVLTINAMGRRMDGEPEPAGGPHPLPVVARYVEHQLPVVIQLPLDPLQVDLAMGRETSKDPKEETPILSSGEVHNDPPGGLQLEPHSNNNSFKPGTNSDH